MKMSEDDMFGIWYWQEEVENEEGKREEREVHRNGKHKCQDDEVVKCPNCGWEGERCFLVVKKHFLVPKSPAFISVLVCPKCGTRIQ